MTRHLVHFTSAAVLTVASIVTYTDFSFGFVSVGGLLFALVSMVLAGAALLFAFRRRWFAVFRWSTLCLATLGGPIVGPNIIENQEARSMASGDALAMQIKEYYAVHAEYPGKLSDLSAERNVPPSAMGVIRFIPFWYEQSASKFTLAFPTYGFGYCTRGNEDAWYCDR